MKAEQSTARSGYVVLFAASCIIPAVHILFLDQALDRTRGITGLMPGTFLFLKWLGGLSLAAPIAIAVVFGLSWKRPSLASPLISAQLSTWLYVFTAIYAAYGGFLFAVTLYGQ